MSLLLLRTICIKWERGRQKGVHFYDVWVITIAIAGGLKVVEETGAFSKISRITVCPFGKWVGSQ